MLTKASELDDGFLQEGAADMNANRNESVSPGQMVFTEQPDAAGQERAWDLDVTKRDRFELLSAYLDGEVSPEERRLVLTWLESDPNAQCLYQRLLHLRQGFQGLCHDNDTVASAEVTANQVLHRLNQRFRFTCMASFAAIAVAVVGALSGAFSGRGGAVNLLIQAITPAPTTENPLEIALDQPAIAIPKAAVTTDVATDSSLSPAYHESWGAESEL